jgi:hypothetical protein
VEAARLRDRRLYGCLHVRIDRDIRHYEKGAATALGDAIDGALPRRFVTLAHRHVRTFGSEELGTLSTDPTAGSRDERDLPCQSAFGCSTHMPSRREHIVIGR